MMIKERKEAMIKLNNVILMDNTIYQEVMQRLNENLNLYEAYKTNNLDPDVDIIKILDTIASDSRALTSMMKQMDMDVYQEPTDVKRSKLDKMNFLSNLSLGQTVKLAWYNIKYKGNSELLAKKLESL